MATVAKYHGVVIDGFSHENPTEFDSMMSQPWFLQFFGLQTNNPFVRSSPSIV
jgi:hypothetical protein